MVLLTSSSFLSDQSLHTCYKGDAWTRAFGFVWGHNLLVLELWWMSHCWVLEGVGVEMVVLLQLWPSEDCSGLWYVSW